MVRTGRCGSNFSVLLDDVDLGFANPWPVRVTPDNSMVIVISSGTSDALLIDQAKLLEKIAASNRQKTASALGTSRAIENDLTINLGRDIIY